MQSPEETLPLLLAVAAETVAAEATGLSSHICRRDRSEAGCDLTFHTRSVNLASLAGRKICFHNSHDFPCGIPWCQ
jgi:hypothetical protein